MREIHRNGRFEYIPLLNSRRIAGSRDKERIFRKLSRGFALRSLRLWNFAQRGWADVQMRAWYYTGFFYGCGSWICARLTRASKEGGGGGGKKRKQARFSCICIESWSTWFPPLRYHNFYFHGSPICHPRPPSFPYRSREHFHLGEICLEKLIHIFYPDNSII